MMLRRIGLQVEENEVNFRLTKWNQVTHMQGHQYWVVPCRGVSQQEQEADGAPHAEYDEDDGDEGELPVCHGRQ